MKNTLSVMLIGAMLVLSACGGRTPAPVMAVQYGDDQKSCKALVYEIKNIESEIQRLLPKTDKTSKNVALGVAGWFFLVPLFFMDFKNAEAVEYEAYRQRYMHLSSIAMTKNCSLEPVHLPSVQEMKDQYEAQQKENAEENDQGVNE
jgi:hypothetical protein